MDDRGLRAALLGDASPGDIRHALRSGATILDIRDLSSYEDGHIAGSMHIPLGELLTNLSRIPRRKPVVTCNAGAAESATAAEILNAHGFEALNGGDWQHVAALLRSVRAEEGDAPADRC
jgi:rhodanese-related sulfurtransferase